MGADTKWTNVQDFIEMHKVEKGCEFTHTSMRQPQMSFYIPYEDTDVFYSLYSMAIDNKCDMFITEKTRHIGPVVVDLDFRYPQDEDCMRKYDAEFVQELARLYFKAINDYIVVDNSTRVFIMERDKPYISKDILKDGVHFVFPDVVTRVSIKKLIRKRFIEYAGDVLENMDTLNTVDDIVDEAIIAHNNWFMYGSKKPNTTPYKITSVLQASDDLSLKVIKHNYTTQQLVQTLSIRNKYNESVVQSDQVQIVEEFDEQEEMRRRRMEASKAIISNVRNERVNTTADIDEIKKLVSILNPSRAENYYDWIRVGWCLRNIDSRLISVWEEFSKQSPKYRDGECEKVWDNMRDGGLGSGTLHMWAKQDNEEEYKKLLRSDLKKLIEQSLSGTHYDVALVIHHLYKHDFVCASAKNKYWYEFKNHRWNVSDSGIGLRQLISDAVWKEYNLTAIEYTQQAIAVNNQTMQTQLQNTATKLQELSSKLKVTAFKESVMKECTELFYIEKFEEKLDANPNLIGFENGVYDLENMEFREGRPEDYISFTTGINYIEYNARSSQIQAINSYLSQVFVKEHMRDYVMKLFASFLTGQMKEQKFYIWTGSGANSKSMLVNLFERAYGDYCCKFPITLLTQKRAASNAATSELARAKGKRFGCLQEPSEDEKLNIGLMKELSGGDKIMARAIYKEPVEFRPMFKLLLLCNQLPNVPSDDGGTWRRIRVVEFTSKFVDDPKEPNEFKIDYDLAEKMNKWPEHFMALLLQYYKKYMVEGLIEPEEVLRCTMEYKAQNDHIALYLLNRVEKKDSGFLPIDDIYSDFRDWIKEDGIMMSKMPSKQEIEKYLSRNLTKMVQPGGIKGFKGYRLKPRALDDMPDAIDGEEGEEDQ